MFKSQFLLLPLGDKALVFMIFLFPSLVVFVRHGGTTIYILLFLMSLFSEKIKIKSLSKDERYVLYGFMIFVAVMLFGFINTDVFKIGVHQLERYLRLIMFIPIYLMLRHKDLELSVPFIVGCIFAAIVIAVQAYIEVEILNVGNASGGYNKIVFGDAAIIITGICFSGLYVLGGGKVLKAALILGILLSIYASIQSSARSSWLALIALAILFIIIIYKHEMPKKRWKKIGFGFTIVLVLVSLWQPKKLVNGVESAINNIEQYNNDPAKESSFGDRLKMWQAAWLLFLEKPVTGVGLGDYRYERSRLIKEGKVFKTYAYGHAHNHYLNVLAENGIIGLIALIICIFLLPAKAFYSQEHNIMGTPEQRFWSLTGLVVLTCFFVYGISEVWLGRNPFVNIYCILILVTLAGLNRKTSNLEN